MLNHVDDNDGQSLIKDLGIVVMLFVLGYAMISNPHMFDDVHATGRRFLIKIIFSYIWGIPVGVMAIGGGLFFSYRFYADYIRKK